MFKYFTDKKHFWWICGVINVIVSRQSYFYFDTTPTEIETVDTFNVLPQIMKASERLKFCGKKLQAVVVDSNFNVSNMRWFDLNVQNNALSVRKNPVLVWLT